MFVNLVRAMVFRKRPPVSPFRQCRRRSACDRRSSAAERRHETARGVSPWDSGAHDVRAAERRHERGTGHAVDPSPPVTCTSFSHVLCRPLRGCGLGCLFGPGAHAPLSFNELEKLRKRNLPNILRQKQPNKMRKTVGFRPSYFPMEPGPPGTTLAIVGRPFRGGRA